MLRPDRAQNFVVMAQKIMDLQTKNLFYEKTMKLYNFCPNVVYYLGAGRPPGAGGGRASQDPGGPGAQYMF